jgi:hypothetical protein
MKRLGCAKRLIVVIAAGTALVGAASGPALACGEVGANGVSVGICGVSNSTAGTAQSAAGTVIDDVGNSAGDLHQSVNDLLSGVHPPCVDCE